MPRQFKEDTNEALLNVMEDLEAEKAKDEAILASIGDGIIAVGLDGKIIVMNKVAESLLGWKTSEAIGKLYNEVISLEDEKGTNIPLGKRPLARALNSKTTTTTTTTSLYLLSKNKIKFPVAITVSPIILNNKISGAVEVFRDITREKEIDKTKTEFVSLASHQLRTPLTSINWYVEMLTGKDVGALNTKQKEYLGEVYKGSRRMVQLVNDLLNVSRLETGQVKIEAVPTDLKAFFEGVHQEVEPLIAETGCQVRFEMPKEEIPKVNIDKILFRQVIVNLLINAIRYSCVERKGHVLVTLVVGPKGYTTTVEDDGIGIPREAQGRIFEKFFRSDNARAAIADGNGLGLYLAKRIMESSGGSLWFKSSGRGTIFYVNLLVSGMKSKEGEKKLE